jgi:ribonuclease P protein component
MLARNRRVSKNSFSLFKGPIKNFYSGPLSIRVAKNPKAEPTRLSVVVSKKIASSAVVRNRIRRKILGVAREFVLKSKPGFVCLVYPKIEVDNLPSGDLRTHLKNIFSSVGLL